MKTRDLVSSAFWIVVGFIFCLGAVKYGFMHLRTLGAGFFPFIPGITLMGLSVVVLLSAIGFFKGSKIELKESFFPERDSLKKLLLALIALFVYAFALKYLGFLVTTFLFMVFLLKVIDPQRWGTVFITALVTSAAAQLLFKTWLKVQLPRGILGL